MFSPQIHPVGLSHSLLFLHLLGWILILFDSASYVSSTSEAEVSRDFARCLCVLDHVTTMNVASVLRTNNHYCRTERIFTEVLTDWSNLWGTHFLLDELARCWGTELRCVVFFGIRRGLLAVANGFSQWRMAPQSTAIGPMYAERDAILKQYHHRLRSIMM